MIHKFLCQRKVPMSIPDFQSMMLPLLKSANDQQEHTLHASIEELGKYYQLTDSEREELLPSGRQATFDNRVSWATTHLKHAGLLESTRRGYFKISQTGVKVLQQNPSRIDMKFLSQFPEYLLFAKASKKEKNGVEEVGLEIVSKQTPTELLEEGYQSIRQELIQDMLSQVKSCSPSFFENLVVELLVKMGYGGSRKDAGNAVGKSGDEGIDGTIKEDRLGLDIIYIQAKKWEGVVSRPEIQKFAGALQGQRAKKGIFITTSYFSGEAYRYVEYIDSKIVLIDGKMLAELMIDNDIGVSKVTTYEIKRIDTDYFTEV